MTPAAQGLLAAVVRFSLRFRGVVIALACVMLAYAAYILPKATYDVFPEFAPPLVVIQTEAPGLSPEQVEVLVTQPVENAVNGLAGIEALRSSSVQGLSIITVTFAPSSNVYLARQIVSERLASVAGQLPRGVRAPGITPLTSSTSIVMAIGLTSTKQSLMNLRTVAEWTMRPRLLSVPGVAKVAVFGGEVKQFQIQVHSDRLLQYNLTLADVLAAAQHAAGVRGAGFIDNPNQRIVIQTQGQASTGAQLAATVLLRQAGVNVTLGDVARVAEAPDPPIGAAAIQGVVGVQLVISQQYGSNTLDVTRKAEAALEQLKPLLDAQGIALHPTLFRPANFIQTAVENVRSSLLIGAGLVVLVLFVFLFNWRTAAISLTAIPLSLLAAVVVLYHFGISLNTMTLGGLAIAVGLVVDDAVIDVENIYRRLRENRRAEHPRSVVQVVFDAALEVRTPVVYATLAVALVFIPVLTLSGVSGRLFQPLGIAYVLATLASLLVATTVTPALCLMFLGKQERLPAAEPPVVHWLRDRYEKGLARVEASSKTVIATVIVLTLGSLAALPFLGGGFLPELREGHFIVHMSAVPGTSLQESLRVGRQVAQELAKLPFIRSVAQRAGRAEKADDVWGTHYSELNVDLKPLQGEEAEIAQSDIRKALAQFPGVNFAVKTFLTERVEETLSGYTASVVINIFGVDLDALDRQAKDVARAVAKLPGAADVQVQSPPGAPQAVVRLREADLLRWGFDPITVLDAVHTAYQGEVAGQVYEGNRVVDVAVILDPSSRKSVSDLGSLPLRSPTGAYVKLRDVADVFESAGRYVVLHSGSQRVQTVTANVAGRDVNAFVAEARQRIASDVKLTTGSYVEFGGTAEAQAQSRRDLLLHSAFAGVAIVLLLSMAMGHLRNLLLLLVNLPFALVGGVLAVFAFGGTLSIGALVGFVTLFGITLRNAILMISHYEHLVTVEGMTWGPQAAVRGASERLSPILMTSLATALGLLPLAVGSGAPGREIEGPMAIVILGGLVTSTLLNLLVLPTLALRFGRFVRSNPAEQGATAVVEVR